MLSKESKIRVLENFYAVDYILFGKPASKIDTCCPMVREEYLSIKGALLSVHLEMLKLIEHNPKSLTESVDKTKLMDNAKKSARIAREQAQKIVTSKKARENIKESIKEALQENSKVNVSNLVEKQIRMKAFGLAIDNLLIARAIQEGSQYSELDSWEGQIIEDSYKILRDNLIEAAYMMIYNEDEEVVDEGAVAKGVALGALAGFLSPIPGGIIGGMVLGAATGAAVKALANWKKANQEKVEKYCTAKFGKDKAKYYECKALGRKAMTVELEKAKAKIKAAKAKRESHDLSKENLTEAPIQYSGSKIVALATTHGNTVEKKEKAGCEKWSIKAPFKGQEYRDKMMACKARAAIMGLKAGIAYAKKLAANCKDLKCKKQISNFIIDSQDDIKDNAQYLK